MIEFVIATDVERHHFFSAHINCYFFYFILRINVDYVAIDAVAEDHLDSEWLFTLLFIKRCSI